MSSSMFERYTAEAKRAIYFAHVEALHRNEKAIWVGDLLVGLTWEKGSRACKLGSLEERAVSLRSLVGIPHMPSTSRAYKMGEAIPLDEDGKKAVAYAAQEADRDRQYWIDSDHLLRGLLRFPNDAKDALLQIGVDLNLVRTASTKYRAEVPALPAPKGARAKLAFKEYWFRALIILVVLIIFAYLKSQG